MTARPMDVTQRMLYLRSIPIASILPAPVLKIIASQVREVRFAKGDALMRQGEHVAGLYFLMEGRVQLVRKGAAIGKLAPPQTLGFLDILSKGDGSYEATAEVDTGTLVLDADTLTELIEDHFDLMRATLRYVCERLLHELAELPAEALSTRLDGRDVDLPEGREMDLLERIDFLRGTSAFQTCNLNALAAMAKQLEECRFPAGDDVWSPGEPAESSLWILRGRVRCRDESGRTWFGGPTSVVGGLEALAARPRFYTLTAETDVVAFRSPTGSYVDLLEDDAVMASAFIARLASDLIGLLMAKAEQGKSTISVPREVTNLGAVLVGA